MRVTRWLSLGIFVASMAAGSPGAALAFDIDYKATPETLKAMKIERTGPGEDYQDHAALFLRLIPAKGNRVFPAFINTDNYLTCPDKEKKYLLYQVSESDVYKRSGIRILAFFFEKAECDNPTYHMDAVVADS